MIHCLRGFRVRLSLMPESQPQADFGDALDLMVKAKWIEKYLKNADGSYAAEFTEHGEACVKAIRSAMEELLADEQHHA